VDANIVGWLVFRSEGDGMKRRTAVFALLAILAAVSCQQSSQFKTKVAEQRAKVKDGGSSSAGWTHVDAADGGTSMLPDKTTDGTIATATILSPE
jgi:hypothetical protein